MNTELNRSEEIYRNALTLGVQYSLYIDILFKNRVYKKVAQYNLSDK